MTPKVVYLSTVTKRCSDEVPGGWDNIADFGCAVAMAYNTAHPGYTHYYESALCDLVAEMRDADLVVGFNLRRFDYTLLEAATYDDLSDLHTFDMLPLITDRLTHRVSLDNLARATLDRTRTDARFAVEYWHRGQIDKVLEFARTNVDLVRKLFAHGCRKKHLLYWSPDARAQARLSTANWQSIARKIVSRRGNL